MTHLSRHLRHGQSQRTRGFTLLELIVVLTILSLIMTAAFGSVRLGSRSFEAGVMRANETEQIRTSADFLRRQFAQLVPIVHDIDADAEISFSGDREQMRFIAPAPGSDRHAGLYVYTLTLENRFADRRLLIAYSPYDPGADNFADRQERRQTLLAANLGEAFFAYFGLPNDEANLKWYDNWSSEDTHFPQIVRIRMAAAEDPADWPDLTFVIRAEEVP